ncbi:DUF3574 domain-containing protein [Xanthobacter sp. 126]|jgi:hypothetical protein|uniref:DUF3574 domain-containing protein n=1 Tax=Xanthobacter sp. 126 TaxID=1131814 RepID=UPI00045E8505|nr:DUF3574 domain-containing protein [Xanthobacter sp. 126]
MPLPTPFPASRREAWRCAALLFAVLLLSTGLPPAHARAEEASPATLKPGISVVMIETKLLFGLASADGSGVSEQEWEGFLASEVTPRFPDGLTVVAAYGQVKGEAHGTAQVVREGMRLVLIYHPDTPEAAAKLAEIRKVYSERFHQWGVLQVTNAVRVTL